MTVGEFVRRYYTERTNTDNFKWDQLDEIFNSNKLIPMWIADMDFKTPNVVREAIKKRAEHGVFGYTYVPDSFYDALISWNKEEHLATYEKEWIRLTSGIVTALYHAISIFTKSNDAVIELSPVYFPFARAAIETGRRIVKCPLKNTNGIYTIDFKLFEELIIKNKVKLFINCSPHNPVGRIWSEGELDLLYSICAKHGVLIVSDEIHQDFEITKNQTPSINVNNGKYKDNLIIFNSASKTFNFASLLIANIIIPNDELRKKYDEEIIKYCLSVNNSLSLVATETAYSSGIDWKNDLLDVIRSNFKILKSTIEKYAPNIIISPLEGTYLAWLDLTPYINKEDVHDFCIETARIAPEFGEEFDENYKGFIRLNLATHPDIVQKVALNIAINITKYNDKK